MDSGDGETAANQDTGRVKLGHPAPNWDSTFF